jgi:GGDEF domain-containing protein
MHWILGQPMLLSRDDLVSALFCETDRAQRLSMPLALIHIGFADWVSGQSAIEDANSAETACLIDERLKGLLRCYDSAGHLADEELILILPGCSLFNAKALAERIRNGVFEQPFECRGQEMRLAACFGVVSSGGRSPFVVLRDCRNALQRALASGPATIHCLRAGGEPDPDRLLVPTLLNELPERRLRG